jgi:hypothetical protein
MQCLCYRQQISATGSRDGIIWQRLDLDNEFGELIGAASECLSNSLWRITGVGNPLQPLK